MSSNSGLTLLAGYFEGNFNLLADLFTIIGFCADCDHNASVTRSDHMEIPPCSSGYHAVIVGQMTVLFGLSIPLRVGLLTAANQKKNDYMPTSIFRTDADDYTIAHFYVTQNPFSDFDHSPMGALKT